MKPSERTRMARTKMPKKLLLGIDNFLVFIKAYKNKSYDKCRQVIHGPIEHPRLPFSAANGVISTVSL